MAAKMVTIVGDVTGPSSATTHKIYLHLVEKIKGIPKKVKSFRNTATNQKL